MKKIFLGTLFIALMTVPAMAGNDGGKKKAKKKANTECKMDKCDPKDCDPKNCDLKCCDDKACPTQPKCNPANCAAS